MRVRKDLINRSPGSGDSTHIEDHKALVEYIDHYPSYPIYTFSYIGGSWFNNDNSTMTTEELQGVIDFVIEEDSEFFIVKNRTTFDINNIHSATDDTTFQVMVRPHVMGGYVLWGLFSLSQRVAALEAKIP